jgi:hypothetical protein
MKPRNRILSPHEMSVTRARPPRAGRHLSTGAFLVLVVSCLLIASASGEEPPKADAPQTAPAEAPANPEPTPSVPAPAAESAKPESPPPAPAPAPAICPFCRSPLAGADFCRRCGRLAQVGPPSSEARFWADAPYVLAFPPQENAPEIRSEFTAQGLARESVRYPSGDRYDLKMAKNGAAIEGKVGWLKGGKETDYSAEMEDTLDDSQRLVSRQVTGKLKADPDMYLYRKLDYRYRKDGRLDRIEFSTSFYRGASDWRKSPAAWLRHSAGEIVLRRDDGGTLTQIETSIREGKRSLRGEPEYGEPRLRVELVTREADQVTGVSIAQP